MGGAWAQTATRTFEVASVKLAHGGPVKIQADPGRLTISDESLDVLIRVAYGLREYEYQGPSWLHTTRYDIVAATGAPQPRAVELEMLRTLLADRFRLRLRHESKTLPIYALVEAKGGAKLKSIDADAPAPFDLYSNFHMEPQPGDVTALRGMGSLGQLSDFLSRVAERPVIDMTGIKGSFDFKLICAIDGFPGFETSPTVFDALQAQMGLRLEARTSAVDITVVDYVEKPAEN